MSATAVGKVYRRVWVDSSEFTAGVVAQRRAMRRMWHGAGFTSWRPRPLAIDGAAYRRRTRKRRR